MKTCLPPGRRTAARLGERAPPVRHVLERLGGEHEVERRVVVRQARQVLARHLPGTVLGVAELRQAREERVQRARRVHLGDVEPAEARLLDELRQAARALSA